MNKRTGKGTFGCLSVLLLIGLAVLLFTLRNQGRDAGEPVPENRGPAAPKFQPITMAQYLRVKDGMTYRQVVDVFGREGEEIARQKSEGLTTVSYSWANADGSNVQIMLQNDRVVLRAQSGLK